MFSWGSRICVPIPWWRAFRSRLKLVVDRLSIVVRGRHTASPAQIGQRQHDCALWSLYWAAPSVPEADILSAFNLAAETWPYGGVTNKEFVIALKYLGVDNIYSTTIETLGELLVDRPEKCVALLHGHFIPIVDGVIVGHDAHRHWAPDTHVYCHWTFNSRAFRRVRNSRRTSSGSA